MAELSPILTFEPILALGLIQTLRPLNFMTPYSFYSNNCIQAGKTMLGPAEWGISNEPMTACSVACEEKSRPKRARYYFRKSATEHTRSLSPIRPCYLPAPVGETRLLVARMQEVVSAKPRRTVFSGSKPLPQRQP